MLAALAVDGFWCSLSIKTQPLRAPRVTAATPVITMRALVCNMGVFLSVFAARLGYQAISDDGVPFPAVPFVDPTP
jgi:hypothetical protein